jgi:peptidoglycan LD-endopeptidase CwlK
MSHIRFYYISGIALSLAVLFYFGFNNYKVNSYFSKKSALTCDSTIVPEFSVFDVANTIYQNPILFENANKIILITKDTSGAQNLYAYNRQTDDFNEIRDENSAFPQLNAADSIALKALISPNPKLYERWWNVIKPHREYFWEKRSQLFEGLSIETPKYDYKIVSDFRQSDNQAKLLKAGKSASPLSQHQFGLAADVAIKQAKTYLKEFKTYKVMGVKAEEKGLYWGGNFKGFVDPGHIQLFENSAKLLSNLPELRFEFEPYKDFYYDRVEKMTNSGKEKSVEDSKELLQILEALNEGKLCKCNQSIGSDDIKFSLKNSKLLASIYEPKQDYLVEIDSKSRILAVISPTGKYLKHRIGTWN